MSEPEILTRVDGAVGRITLNRPAALHALTTGMCEAMTGALTAWRDDPAVRAVMLDHAGGRGFCAGGDIRMIAQSGYGDGAAAREFFQTEYRLNILLFGYAKPIVAFMDGVVMGGGVGIALPCRFRVVTERTTLAMPETGIGLFPDVGGGWHLPRLPRRAGYWLGLTGARLKAADCRLLGLATHYAPSAALEAIKSAILADPDALEPVLSSLTEDADAPPLAEHLDEIERAFAAPSVEAVIAALREGSAWGQAQAAVLALKSPQSMKVTWRLMTLGAAMTDFSAHMLTEFRLSARVVHSHDFLQGVRAVIVVKDNDPRWYPPSLADISETMLDRTFAPLPAQEERRFLAEEFPGRRE